MTDNPTYLAQIKVRGYHLDLYGHVNNARYLEFLEEARWEMMERRPEVAQIHERGLAFVVVNINIDYRRPATNGEVLQVATRLANVGNRAMTYLQTITLTGSQQVVAEARVTFVLVDTETGRPVVLDDGLREILGVPAGANGEIPA